MIRGICALISDTAVGLLAVMLAAQAWNWEFQAPIVLWLFLLILQFLVNDVMMRKGISTNLYLLWNLAAVIGETAVLQYRLVCGHESLAVILGMASVFAGSHCGLAAYRLPGSNQLVKYVDVMVVMLGLYLYFVYHMRGNCSESCMILTGTALFADMFSINRSRTGEEAGYVIQGAGMRGKLLLMTIFLSSLAVTVGIVGLASGQIHSLVDLFLYLLQYIWAVVSVIIAFLEKILTAIILVIVMLLPATPPAARDALWMQMHEHTQEQAEEISAFLPEWVMMLFFGVLLMLLLGAVLYQFRGMKTRRIRQQQRRKKMVRRSRFFTALKELLQHLKWQLEFEWNYQRYKKTPMGLFVLAERTGKKHSLKRMCRESPAAYLRRFSKMQGNTELESLAELLDECCYAGVSVQLTEEEYRHYRKQIRLLG